MEQSDLLRRVIGVVEKLRLEYLVTGSIASTYFGEPRFTNDVDIVVRLPSGRIGELCAAFPAPEFYISEDAVRQAVQQPGQFNVIHPASGLKVDFIIARNTPFDRSRFARMMRVRPAPDYEASFATVEDVIVKKMEYFRDGGSEKHLRDILGMLKISGADHAYIADWASRLGLEHIWALVQERLAKS